MHCLEYRDLLRAGDLRRFLWGHYAYYPPLVYQITGALHAVLGPGPWVAWMVLQAFALSLAAVTHRLGRFTGGPLVAGLGAATLVLLPIITVFTREFALDVPLVAASTLLLVLALEDPLRSGRRAAALGVAVGLGLLIKWSFALAAVGPVAYVVSGAIRSREKGRARRLALALAVAAALAAPWYVSHLRRLWDDAHLNALAVASREGDPAPVSFDSLAYYALMAVNEWFFLPLAALAAWGLTAAVRARGRVLLLASVAVWPAYLLFTSIPNKDPRYGLPMVPPLCVVAAQAIAGLRGSLRRRVAVASVAALLAVQHVAGVRDLGPLSARVNVCVPGPALVLYDPADPPAYFRFRGKVGGSRTCAFEWTLYNPFSYFGRPPRREDWGTDGIVAALPADAAVQPPPVDDVHLNPVLLEYVARRMGRAIRWAGRPEEAALTVTRETASSATPASGDDCRRFGQPDGTRVAVCVAGR